MINKLKGVYLITNTAIQNQHSHTQLTEMALQGGANIVQFRDKKKEARRALNNLESVVQVCRRYDALSIVNDRVDLSLAAEASGVHLGQDDLPLSAARKLLPEDSIIGGTSSTLKEALEVEQQGADYLALGHIFETSTKAKQYEPRGLDYLHKVCEVVDIPVVAIGGITLDNAAEVIAAGADMVAVSSAICCADDPVKATQKLVDLFPSQQ